MSAFFKGKTCVITGGAGVLCAAFARELAKQGARVAVLDLAADRAEALAASLRAEGYDAIGAGANVLERESLEKAHETVRAAFGPCDILINGAGGNNPRATCDEEIFSAETMANPDKKGFFDLDEKGFDFVYRLNFTGTLLPTQEFARDMIGREGCTILNISSMAAFLPLTKIPAYASAKASISNFTKWLAVYFAKEGIRVNAMAPGFFSTAQNKTLLWNADGTPTARSEKILRNTPMGRFGTPEELLGTLLWLLDATASGFVTGVVIPVDGGFSAYPGV